MTFSLAALPALALLAVPAAQDDGVYLEFGAGITSTAAMEGLVGDADFNAGYALDALVGYRWAEAVGSLDFGLELEGLFTRQRLDDPLLGPGSSDADYLSTGAFFLNGALSWQYSREIAFYGGAGIGIAPSLTLEDKSTATSAFSIEDDSALVYQGKLGMRFTMAENLAWYLQYRRVQSEEMTVSDSFLDQSFDYEIEQDIFEIGIRYGF